VLKHQPFKSNKAKFKSKSRHWLIIVPFILLVVGLVVAIFLLGINQDLRQQAAPLYATPVAVCTAPGQERCSVDGSRVEKYEWPVAAR
jgi:flagellar basal body-associated protein FliL